MFGLFGKKEEKSPEERLAGLQNKKDWAGLSKAYYEMGKAAMDRGDLNHAQLWLHRADTIYSADDATCEKVGDKIMDDCSDRIGALEEEGGLLYNSLPAQIEEKADGPGCEVLGELGWAVDMMFKSIQEAPSQEEYQRLMSVCNGLYELNSKPAYYTGEIEVPGKAPFQVFDLNGMMGVEQELNSCIDNHLRLLAALSQGAEGLHHPARLPRAHRHRKSGGGPPDQGGAGAHLERFCRRPGPDPPGGDQKADRGVQTAGYSDKIMAWPRRNTPPGPLFLLG